MSARRACLRSRSELDSSKSEGGGASPKAVVFDRSFLFVGFGRLSLGESGRISIRVISFKARDRFTTIAAAVAIATLAAKLPESFLLSSPTSKP